MNQEENRHHQVEVDRNAVVVQKTRMNFKNSNSRIERLFEDDDKLSSHNFFFPPKLFQWKHPQAVKFRARELFRVWSSSKAKEKFPFSRSHRQSSSSSEKQKKKIRWQLWIEFMKSNKNNFERRMIAFFNIQVGSILTLKMSKNSLNNNNLPVCLYQNFVRNNNSISARWFI